MQPCRVLAWASETSLAWAHHIIDLSLEPYAFSDRILFSTSIIVSNLPTSLLLCSANGDGTHSVAAGIAEFHLKGLLPGALLLLSDDSSAASDTPCYSTSGASLCCGQGFACLANGICQVTSFARVSDPDLNKQINYCRGSFTDQTWSSSSCPQFSTGTQYANMCGNRVRRSVAHEFTR
jgi:hypothetical protein